MKKVDDLADGLRQGMRRLASGVCVISGFSETLGRAAMTASSVTSVSDEPPSLLVCVNKSAQMDEVLKGSEHFCVNILSSEQQEVSEVCATPELGEERFSVGTWQQYQKSGLYYLQHAPAVFVCAKQKVFEHGTHSIYVANVDEVLVSDLKQQALVYAEGRYHYL
ncbi:flavin reductase family protein [Agaribacterium haliotis]|uniref:flavin reductase family protein n=1 Tax=Agaribacterium haliotis TaxID=2013869 RepID=UPI001EFDB9DC|nr:flavin reductase family protein [Agaribacterium haliotis]